jgi:hypothetical protein
MVSLSQPPFPVVLESQRAGHHEKRVITYTKKGKPVYSKLHRQKMVLHLWSFYG